MPLKAMKTNGIYSVCTSLWTQNISLTGHRSWHEGKGIMLSYPHGLPFSLPPALWPRGHVIPRVLPRKIVFVLWPHSLLWFIFARWPRVSWMSWSLFLTPCSYVSPKKGSSVLIWGSSSSGLRACLRQRTLLYLFHGTHARDYTFKPL